MQKLIINGRLPSRNEAENAARAGWAVGANFKKKYTQQIASICSEQGIQKETSPVLLSITFYEKDMRRDSDNIYSAVKYIKDGLVLAGVLQNDTRKWVTEIINPIQLDKQNPRIEVEIKEVIK